MFQYLRKAVSGVQVRDNSRDNLVRDEYQKKKIKEYLASAIKQLQKTYVSSSSEYIIERNDECAQNLCTGLEAVFLHGLADHGNSLQTGVTLRSMFSEGITSSEDDYDQEIATKAFWEIVKEVTHSDVITQLKHLVVTTDVGLSRAWIRLALNDGLIISYLDAILADSSHLRKYYGQNAFLMDRELPGILKELLQGLADFQFRLNYNSSKLNSWDVLPLQLAGHIQHTETSKSSDSTDGKLFIANTTERLKDIETKNDMTDPPLSPVAVKVSEEIKAEPTEQGMSSVTPLSSTPAQPSEVQESQHGSSATSLSLSESLGSTSPPHENANTQNIPSLSNSFSNYSPATQQRMAGNRLSGQGWEGWSSSFENDSAKNFTRKNSAEDEKLKSFGSLLQKYGHNGVAENEECLFDESKNRPALSTIIAQSCSDGENEKMVGVHSPAANDPNLARMNFEVVPSSTSTQGQFLDQRDRLSVEQLTSINSEQGLDKQNFQCKGCAKPIGLIYGPYRVCYFDGGYYCSDCHDEEEHLIPARVIQNWDFKRYKVSKDSKISLMKIEEEPLFHVDEANPFLYDVIMDLREVKVLRIQLQHIKGYIHTCRQEIIEDFRRRLWPREYLAEDVHQYSLLDLVQIKNGQLAHHLKKVIQQFTKHIFKCNLCCQKGFICEYCNDKTIIYPFQVNIAVQCSGCLSVFHKKCRQDKRCPKCVRIHLRHQNRNMDLKLSVTQKEQYIGRDIL